MTIQTVYKVVRQVDGVLKSMLPYPYECTYELDEVTFPVKGYLFASSCQESCYELRRFFTTGERYLVFRCDADVVDPLPCVSLVGSKDCLDAFWEARDLGILDELWSRQKQIREWASDFVYLIESPRDTVWCKWIKLLEVDSEWVGL